MSIAPSEHSSQHMSDSSFGPDRARPLNFAICLGDAFTWPFGMAFFSVSTIVPLFLRQLGASNLIVGLFPAMLSLGYLLPGLLVAGRISRLPRAKWWLFGVAIIERIPLLAISLLIPILGARRPETVLFVFIGGFALHSLFLGLNQPAYWSVIGKVIPMRRRGRLFGLAGLIGGVAGFVIDPVTRTLLTPSGIQSLTGFAGCFLVGTIVLTVGIVPFGLIDEPISQRPSTLEAAIVRGHFLRDSAAVLGSKPAFAQMVLGQCFISMATIAQPFFVMDYGHRFPITSSAIAGFTAVGVVLGAFGSVAWGAWGDHRGNKGVLIVSGLLAVVSASIAFSAPPAMAYYAIFAFNALSAAGIGIAGYNIVMEFAGGTREIASYTAVYNAATAPFRVAAPLVGGVLADHFGYPCVFALSALFAATGIVFTIKMVEPRN